MPYQSGGELGFPDDETAKLLGDITDAFEALLKGKNTAILTAYTQVQDVATGVLYILDRSLQLISQQSACVVSAAAALDICRERPRMARI